MTVLLLVRVLHFAGIIAWIGGLLATGLLLRAGARARPGAIMADAGATFAIVTGLYNAIQGHFFSQHWLHLKLMFVILLIIVHVVLRLRVRRGESKQAGTFMVTVGVLALLIISVVVFRI